MTDLLPGSRRHIEPAQTAAATSTSRPTARPSSFSANSSPSRRTATLEPDVFSVPDGGRRGAEPDRRPTPPTTSEPVFSPDGKRIAYGVERKADGWPDRTRLAVMDVASGSDARPHGAVRPHRRGLALGAGRDARSCSTPRRAAARTSTPSPRPEARRASCTAAAPSPGAAVTREGRGRVPASTICDRPPEMAAVAPRRRRLPPRSRASTTS